ncbi:unnamed protein product, partial [Amoebophrya sp. A120]|eukprot:GSA120T00019134001.1
MAASNAKFVGNEENPLPERLVFAQKTSRSRATKDLQTLLETELYHDLDGVAETMESLKRMGVQCGTYGEVTYNGVTKLIEKIRTLAADEHQNWLLDKDEEPSEEEGAETTADVAKKQQNAPPLKEVLATHDVFYDLGSGVGKLCLQVFLTTEVSKVVGVEWGETRYQKALKAKERLYAQLFTTTESSHDVDQKRLHFDQQLEFRCEDVARTGISDATVVFFCSIVFEEEVVKRVAQRLLENAKQLRFFISTQKVADAQYMRAFISTDIGKQLERRYELAERWRLPMSWTSAEGGNLVYVYRPVLTEQKFHANAIY